MGSRLRTWSLALAAATTVLVGTPEASGEPTDPTALATARRARPADIATFQPRPTRRRLQRRWSVELEFGPVWQSRNDVAVPGDSGSRFALDGLTGSGPFAGGRITVDWRLSRRHAVRALVAPLEFRGTGTLGRPINFAGTRFEAATATRATYKFNSYRIGYRYLLFSGRTWDVHVGATAKIRDAEIELRQGSKVARKTDLGFVPLLHVDAEWRFRPGWRLSMDLDGLAAPQGRAFDLALKLHRDLSSRWSIAVGYRTIEGGADNDSVYTFTWLHQALVSLQVRF